MSRATAALAADLPVIPPAAAHGAPRPHHAPRSIVVVGNPNAGKTTLFNRLTGLRARTANFPGTTVEHREGPLQLGEHKITLVDLPGLYSLEAVSPEERVAVDALEGRLQHSPAPDAVLLVVDATNLERNLFLGSQVLELARPTVIALNLIDAADKLGLSFDIAQLEARLGCRVVPVSARTGRGVPQLLEALNAAVAPAPAPVRRALPLCNSCGGCRYAARFDWADSVGAAATHGAADRSRLTRAIDRVLTHRVSGLAAFAGVMTATFLLIFWAAQFPMNLIDGLFALTAGTLGQWIPEGDFNSFITDGFIGGLGGVLVFLPQICLLFFVLALLEDSGYMARAALVMDRLMRRVGLPGKAFVPMLSAHACAIPAIMSTRVIEDRRDRLAAIMVIPLMTCSARVPVYAMVTALLFPQAPLMAALVFSGAYALGIVAALVMAWVFKKTLLKGEVKPLVIELPNYRRPSLRNAVLLTYDRAWEFIKTAGTTILAISLVLWALATYPKTSLEDLPPADLAAIEQLEHAGAADGAERFLQRRQLEQSFAGRLGRAVEPVFAPLGFDWKMSIGVVTSFAAREVIVSTMAVLYGLGEEAADAPESLQQRLKTSVRRDGTPAFTTATCLSLLVFYVLAMQCLPTQAAARRETGGWTWPLVQLGYMSVLAYTAALATYQVASRIAL